MALVIGDDYEDLVEWVKVIVRDAASEVLGNTDEAKLLAAAIGIDASESFEDLLTNYYGED